MEADTEKRDALRLLAGLEDGVSSVADAYSASQNIDPVLSYIIVSYLRGCYPASDPAASSILERVVRMTSTYPAFVAQCRQGERDPIAQWFEQEHEYREYRGRGEAVIALVLDKINS